MKAFIALLLVVFAASGAPAIAQSSIVSPLLGRWAVDVTRLPIPPAARPKSVTLGFSDAGGGKLMMKVDIVEGTGTQIHSIGTAGLDGSPVSITGSPEADIAAMKLPQPDVLIVSLGRGGAPASTRIYAAGADGERMVETAVYFGHDGRPIMRTNYFTRVR